MRQGVEAVAAYRYRCYCIQATIIVGGVISISHHGYNSADEMLKLSEGTLLMV